MNENNNQESPVNTVPNNEQANKVVIGEPPYNGWLVSNSFPKRAMAVVGHYLAGALMIFVPIAIISVILSV